MAFHFQTWLRATPVTQKLLASARGREEGTLDSGERRDFRDHGEEAATTESSCPLAPGGPVAWELGHFVGRNEGSVRHGGLSAVVGDSGWPAELQFWPQGVLG